MLGGLHQERKYLRSRHDISKYFEMTSCQNLIQEMISIKKEKNCSFLNGYNVKTFHNPDVFFINIFGQNCRNFFCWKVISLWLWGWWATGEAAAKLVTPDRSRQPPRRSTFLVSKNLKKKKTNFNKIFNTINKNKTNHTKRVKPDRFWQPSRRSTFFVSKNV